jgi:hypothetical protein
MLTIQRLRNVLAYEPTTGLFTWLVRTSNRVRVGDVAGSEGCNYLVISVDGSRYLAHRLAWFYVTGEWPPGDIDHKDTNYLNNAWDNLRPATRSQNNANTHRPTTNTSGFKGVWWNPPTCNWRAHIQVNGRHIHLGLFDTPENAHAAYCAAAARHFGEFARYA